MVGRLWLVVCGWWSAIACRLFVVVNCWCVNWLFVACGSLCAVCCFRCWSLVVCCWLVVVNCLLSVDGCWFDMVGCWLWVICIML